MTEHKYAAWVQPIAATLSADRQVLLNFVRSAPAEWWDLPSVVDGWTNHDILAHLAGGNDMLVQTLLRALTSGEVLDPDAFAPDTDAENASRIEERRAWSIAQLVAELQRDSDEVQAWLSKLKEGDRDLRPDGLGMTVGRFFRIVRDEHHDLIHLEQLRLSLSQ